ncbi:hypothetical protein [Paraburkholderia sp. HD33-4]|uniref:hypothetical protein n=1 Tax=Paraburkholderia sp. HD33-4 TaxID=2883242 RepID=UPI001F44B609|nr:hypothetical protein [Paraburkholderia sp. HD33-4]
MPSIDDLIPVADTSAFIFTGSVARSAASTVPTLSVDAATIVVSVEDVVKGPPGLRALRGQEVTVQLLQPLAEGRYVFLADFLAVGEGIAVRERTHLEAAAEKQVRAAVERGYARLIERRVEAAFLVALGTVGAVRPLLPPAQRRGRVPWATAPFNIERVLKGRGKPRHMTLIGPGTASKRLPRAPALRAELHAILILQHPPADALELLPEEEREKAAFIAEPPDIQPHERLEAILKIVGAPE